MEEIVEAGDPAARLSRFDYEVSKSIAAQDYPFYALIAAAMRKADSWNALVLQVSFPQVWDDLQARYHAPDGLLPGEVTP